MSGLGVQPTVDVIVPVYRHHDYTAQAVRSAIQPSISHVLINDDGTSSERLRQVLHELAAESESVSITFSRENYGIVATQNMLIERSRADYVAFMDCDDYLSPLAGARIGNALAESGSDYLFTDRIEVTVDPQAAEIPSEDHRHVRFGGFYGRRFDKSWDLLLLDGMFASHLKVVRRDLLTSLGGFKVGTDGIQDWEFALEAMISGSAKFEYLPDPLYFHRIHAGQETGRARSEKLSAVNSTRRKYFLGLRRSSLAGALPAESRFADAVAGQTGFRLAVDGLAEYDFLALRSDEGNWRFLPAHKALLDTADLSRTVEVVVLGSGNLNRDLLQSLQLRLPSALFAATAWSTALTSQRVYALRFENSYFDQIYTDCPERSEALLPHCHSDIEFIRC